jgi:hypothetical protein
MESLMDDWTNLEQIGRVGFGAGLVAVIAATALPPMAVYTKWLSLSGAIIVLIGIAFLIWSSLKRADPDTYDDV